MIEDDKELLVIFLGFMAAYASAFAFTLAVEVAFYR